MNRVIHVLCIACVVLVFASAGVFETSIPAFDMDRR